MADRVAPRLLTKRQAAEYCACENLSTFDSYIKRGILPKPIDGTKRWDRLLIDQMLDAKSGLATKSAPTTPYAKWKQAHAGADEGGAQGQAEAG